MSCETYEHYENPVWKFESVACNHSFFSPVPWKNGSLRTMRVISNRTPQTHDEFSSSFSVAVRHARFYEHFCRKSDNMCVASYVLNLTYIYGKKIRDHIRTREPTSFISSSNLETVPERLPKREKNVVQSKKAVILAHPFRMTSVFACCSLSMRSSANY